MAEKRETVGKISSELLQKEPETRDPIALEREMHKDYVNHVYDAVARGKTEFPGDFFVVVITKKERLMQNVLRNYFLARSTCPTPEWDQTVYRYKRADDLIEFLWVVPSKDTCQLFKDNALEISPEEKDLLRFVMDFTDGTLLKLAKRLNKEMKSSPLLEKE